RWLTQLYPLLFRIASGFPVTDGTNGMRAFRLDLLDDPAIRLEQDWLDRYELRWDLLIMREFGDYMVAPAFKQRSVAELRHAGFDLRLAFEDDPRNVHMFHNQDVPCVYIHSGYYD
ncbi:MAG TPA: hypothetical protein PLV93_06830, partial [Microthrixaceae bacterium]|nr:hypothetical protein [Microthrixaceae bacterium]